MAEGRNPLWRSAAFRDACLGGITLAAGFVWERSGGGHGGPLALYAATIVLAGRRWIVEAVRDLLRERRVGIDALMAAAAAGAATLGLFDESAAIVFLYGIAEAVEEWTYDRARGAVESLLDLTPPFATRLADGTESRVPAEALQVGDRFLVRPGESLPTDGLVESGTSVADESALTGESIPVEKLAGSRVYAGTINGAGSLVVRATAAFGESTVRRLVGLVEEAQRSRGRSQLIVERFTRIYSPLVLIAAGALLLVPAFTAGTWSTFARLAVVLLVAAAPCALAMSTPVAFAAGVSGAARHGILIKGGRHLELLGRVRTIAFDKTGTLTRGRPEVVRFQAVHPMEPSRAIALIAAVEARSEHPLAEAFVRYARQNGLGAIPDARNVVAIPGAGVQGDVDGKTVRIVHPDALVGPRAGQIQELLRSWAEEGITPAVALEGADSIGLIGFRDEPRSEAKSCLAALRALGVERLVMLSGDRPAVARRIGSDLGIDESRGGLTPEAKVAAIRELVSTSGPVAMVGDGINDAPALAASDVGIAMGALGSDAAIEAADVALMTDTLEHLDEAFVTGRSVRSVVRQNVVFSIAVLAALVPTALAGALSIAQVVFVHEIAELLAVLNGLRPFRAGRRHLGAANPARDREAPLTPFRS